MRGTGTRVGALEQQWYNGHKDKIHVAWQKKAWADRKVMFVWFKEVWKPFIDANFLRDGRYEETILFLDNLDAQIWHSFRDLLKTVGTLAFYYPPNMTDQLAPIDAGPGRALKYSMEKQQEEWLLEDENLQRWLGEENEDGSEPARFTASERRMLLVDRAYKAVPQWSAKGFGVYFEKTGCAITVDGSKDNLIRPEKLDGKPGRPLYTAAAARDSGTTQTRHLTGWHKSRSAHQERVLRGAHVAAGEITEGDNQGDPADLPPIEIEDDDPISEIGPEDDDMEEYGDEDRSCRAIMERYGLKFVDTTEPKVKGKCICRYDIGWFYGTIKADNTMDAVNKRQKKKEDKRVLNSHNVHWDDDYNEVWGFQIDKRLDRDAVEAELEKEEARLLKKSEAGQWFIVEEDMDKA
jgi:hypothetical protein